MLRSIRPRLPLRQLTRCYSQASDAADFANRKQKIADELAEGKTWYPLLQDVAEEQIIRLPDFQDKFSHVTLESPHPSHVTIRGRITKLRRASKGLVFMDLVQDGIKVQTVTKHHVMPDMTKQEFFNATELFKRGDIVSVSGTPGRTPAGELSLIAARPADLLTPCLHPLPSNQSDDVFKRLSNRVVDFSTSPESREMIFARATVISYVRQFFSEKGFLEVETPILSDVAGGASARPFVTESNHLQKQKKRKSDKDEISHISLRVAPELWLKRLVISGFDKVFEVGPSFRNEAIDSTHNPEFTTCEFYWGYAELKDLTDTLEEFFVGLLSTVISKHPSYAERLTPWLEEFQKGIDHVDFLQTIADKSGCPLPRDLNDVSSLVSIYEKLGLKLPSVLSPAKLWDELAAEYVEKSRDGRPMLITNQPELMSPLAKSWSRDGYALSKRFELFIGGMEYANGYEEENSPFAQLDKLISQQQSRDTHADDEAHVHDAGYVTDMEWGLPPTAGCGIGIDRLVMFITGAKSIQQVIPFAGLKMAK